MTRRSILKERDFPLRPLRPPWCSVTRTVSQTSKVSRPLVIRWLQLTPISSDALCRLVSSARLLRMVSADGPETKQPGRSRLIGTPRVVASAFGHEGAKARRRHAAAQPTLSERRSASTRGLRGGLSRGFVTSLGLLHVIDDDELHRPRLRGKVETELLMYGCEEGRTD
jgi:hypothetical protein